MKKLRPLVEQLRESDPPTPSEEHENLEKN